MINTKRQFMRLQMKRELASDPKRNMYRATLVAIGCKATLYNQTMIAMGLHGELR